MLLLITGASGSGKSTARQLAEPHLPAEIVCAELWEIVPLPEMPDVRWRQESTEQAVRYALELQEEGRHLLLAGDPVAVGEVLAAPSATKLDGIAACLLDVDADTQTARLAERGDDPLLLPNHHGFAEWMREHVRDPQHRQFVITEGGWEQMQWQNWTTWEAGDPRWRFTEIDTSELSANEVAGQIVRWCEAVLSGEAPVLSGRWWG